MAQLAATLEDPGSDPHPDQDFIFFLFLPVCRRRKLHSSIFQTISYSCLAINEIVINPITVH